MALPAPTHPHPRSGSTLGFQALLAVPRPLPHPKSIVQEARAGPGHPWACPSPAPAPCALKSLGSALQLILGGGGVQRRFHPSMEGALSLCLWASTSHTVSCLSLPCLRDSTSVCVGPSQLLPTSVSVRLSVPPPHPHPFVCHQDSTLVTTGAKAGQQVCEGVGEGGVRLCGTSPPPPPSDADLFWYPPPLSQARHDLEL